MERDEKGVRVRVDLRMLIESIYVNPIEKSVPPELLQLLDRKGIKSSISLIKVR